MIWGSMEVVFGVSDYKISGFTVFLCKVYIG